MVEQYMNWIAQSERNKWLGALGLVVGAIMLFIAITIFMAETFPWGFLLFVLLGFTIALKLMFDTELRIRARNQEWKKRYEK